MFSTGKSFQYLWNISQFHAFAIHEAMLNTFQSFVDPSLKYFAISLFIYFL